MQHFCSCTGVGLQWCMWPCQKKSQPWKCKVWRKWL